MHLFIKSHSVWPIFSLFSVFSKLWHLGPYLIHRGGKQLLCMHNFDVWTKHSQPILPNTSSQLPILNTPGQGTGQLKPRVHRYFSNYPILNPLSLFTFLYSFPKKTTMKSFTHNSSLADCLIPRFYCVCPHVAFNSLF